MNPAHNVKPARSATSNALGAILGAKFLCRQCGSWHAPGSRLIDCCRRRFTSERFRYDYARWRADLTLYYNRVTWRKHNDRWSNTDQQAFAALTEELDGFSVYAEFGIATLAELVLDNGLELLQQRHDTWQADTQRRIADAQAKAQDVLAKLDTLLPPPYPVGPPQYQRYYAGPKWTPTAATQAELDRVANLATPPIRITVDTVSKRALLQWSPARTDRIEICQAIERTFSATLHDGERRKLRQGRFESVIDRLGLDPAFWSRIEITKRRFTLITRHFSQAPLPAITLGGQLALPFAPGTTCPSAIQFIRCP